MVINNQNLRIDKSTSRLITGQTMLIAIMQVTTMISDMVDIRKGTRM